MMANYEPEINERNIPHYKVYTWLQGSVLGMLAIDCFIMFLLTHGETREHLMGAVALGGLAWGQVTEWRIEQRNLAATIVCIGICVFIAVMYAQFTSKLLYLFYGVELIIIILVAILIHRKDTKLVRQLKKKRQGKK